MNHQISESYYNGSSRKHTKCVERQQFKSLWKNKLSSRRYCSTEFPVRMQNVDAKVCHLLPNLWQWTGRNFICRCKEIILSTIISIFNKSISLIILGNTSTKMLNKKVYSVTKKIYELGQTYQIWIKVKELHKFSEVQNQIIQK